MNRKQVLVWNFLKSVFFSISYVWFVGRAWKTIFSPFSIFFVLPIQNSKNKKHYFSMNPRKTIFPRTKWAENTFLARKLFFRKPNTTPLGFLAKKQSRTCCFMLFYYCILFFWQRKQSRTCCF